MTKNNQKTKTKTLKNEEYQKHNCGLFEKISKLLAAENFIPESLFKR